LPGEDGDEFAKMFEDPSEEERKEGRMDHEESK
jgi:hypothetical protein